MPTRPATSPPTWGATSGPGRGIQLDGNIVAAGNVGGLSNALVIQADGKLVAAGSGRGRRVSSPSLEVLAGALIRAQAG